MIDHETWHTLMTKPQRAGVERALIQCIASLSSHPSYARMTAEEIYEKQYEFADGLYGALSEYDPPTDGPADGGGR